MATPTSPPETTSASAHPAPAAAAASAKPIHSLVLDTGPLIKNDPPVDVLRARAECLFTIPSVVSEIRDAATRSRVETTLMPFLTLRSPKPESVRFITGFARRTGDLEVLSRPDIELLALTYELECERNGGDWRLRNMPGQKTLNGRPPRDTAEASAAAETEVDSKESQDGTETPQAASASEPEPTTQESGISSLGSDLQQLQIDSSEKQLSNAESTPTTTDAEAGKETTLADGEKADEAVVLEAEASDDDSADDDGEGGWITPSNVKKHKDRDGNNSTTPTQGQPPVTLQAAILTSDFAMQNVALRVNLNLLSPQLSRISRLKTWVLRCHACFRITRDMERRFCPTCGQATLIRAACSVDDRSGQLTVHLKKNFQWNNRGNVYSVPKPVHGSANGRAPRGSKSGGGATAGGQNGWGRDLILAEDQKEHVRAVGEQRRQRKKDIMDEDYLPGILSGSRSGGGGKIRVGAGRNVNSKRKK